MPIFKGGRAATLSIRHTHPSRGRGSLVRPWLTIAAVLVVALSLTSVASADAHKARFEATAAVTNLGLMGGTAAAFDTNKKGEIKRLQVETFGELIASDPGSGGGIVVTSCDESEAAQEFCDSITNAGILSLHDSSATMRRPALMEVSLQPGNPDGPVQQQLFGTLTGHLHSSFSINQPDGQLLGTARLRIAGDASYGCFTLIDGDPSPDGVEVFPFPELQLGVCQGTVPSGAPEGAAVLAPPMMLPTMLDINDDGQFKVRTATGKFADMNIRQVKGKVNVDLTAIGAGYLVGSINITDGKVKFSRDKDKEKRKDHEDGDEDDDGEDEDDDNDGDGEDDDDDEEEDDD